MILKIVPGQTALEQAGQALLEGFIFNNFKIDYAKELCSAHISPASLYGTLTKSSPLDWTLQSVAYDRGLHCLRTEGSIKICMGKSHSILKLEINIGIGIVKSIRRSWVKNAALKRLNANSDVVTLIKKDRDAGKTAPGAFHECVPVAGCYIRMSKRTAQSLHPPESATGKRINCKFLFFFPFFFLFIHLK